MPKGNSRQGNPSSIDASIQRAPDALAKNLAEADAVLGCWHDIMQGKYGKGGKPKQMHECSLERTGITDADRSYFIMEHPMPDSILAVVPNTNSTFIGTQEDILKYNKDLYEQGHADTVAIVNTLILQANKQYLTEAEDITTKSMEPPTGDKRTYMSLATYCWPSNPEDLQNPKGPWTCTDGKQFPGRRVIAPDYWMLIRAISKSYKMAMAYYFTGAGPLQSETPSGGTPSSNSKGDEKWAEGAVKRIRRFFLDEKSGMLPTLLYAQLKPGMSDVGSPTGTIDMKNVAQLFDAIAMLHSSKHWTREDATAMQDWMGQYAEYLTTEHVIPERMSINNHGTYFDLQYVSILRYLGRITEAKHYLNTVGKERVRLQIRGALLPSELIRPKSFDYHNFELEAYVRLALQADQMGLDLWTFQAEHYNSIQDAWDQMARHWCDRGSNWTVAQASQPSELYRPANYMGALYNQARVDGAYTKRSFFYMQLFHSLGDMHAQEPTSDDIDWDVALISQLPLVRMDDCFITACKDHRILEQDPPSFEAPCAPMSTNGFNNRIMSAISVSNSVIAGVLFCSNGIAAECAKPDVQIALKLAAYAGCFALISPVIYFLHLSCVKARSACRNAPVRKAM